MGDLVKTESNSLAESKTASAGQIMAVCRVVTPQFYKGLAQADLKAEKAAIELLTAHISPEVMQKMCELAVQNYGLARSDNNKVYFDVNYILTFYTAAFNWFWCDNAELPKDADWVGSAYNDTSRVLTELWRSADGMEYTIKHIQPEDYNKMYQRHEKNGGWRHHSPRYWQREDELTRERWENMTDDDL